MVSKVKILNIEVDNLTIEELLDSLKGGFVVTPNADHIVQLQNNPEFLKAYQNADFTIVDSQVVYWSTYLLGTPVKQKISGSDFLPAYYTYHRDNPDIRIYLLGGMPGIAEEAARRINRKTGRMTIVGTDSPPMGFDSNSQGCNRAIRLVNDSTANVLVVGLGAPKQEIWITKYKDQMPGIHTFMALGATIDFEAGNVRRAPPWMSRCGIEWIFRLSQDPRRLWIRYLHDLLFPLLVMKQRLGLYKAPFENNS